MKLSSRWTLYALAPLILFAAIGIALWWKTILLGIVGWQAWRFLYRQAKYSQPRWRRDSDG